VVNLVVGATVLLLLLLLLRYRAGSCRVLAGGSSSTAIRNPREQRRPIPERAPERALLDRTRAPGENSLPFYLVSEVEKVDWNDVCVLASSLSYRVDDGVDGDGGRDDDDNDAFGGGRRRGSSAIQFRRHDDHGPCSFGALFVRSTVLLLGR